MFKIPTDEQRQLKLQEQRQKHSSEQILSLIFAALLEKTESIFAVKLTEEPTLADYIVICTGNTARQSGSINEAVRKNAKEQGIELLNPAEGFDENWTILDFGTSILHIMSPKARQNYKLEELWQHGQAISPTEFLQKYPCDLSSSSNPHTEK